MKAPAWTQGYMNAGVRGSTDARGGRRDSGHRRESLAFLRVRYGVPGTVDEQHTRLSAAAHHGSFRAGPSRGGAAVRAPVMRGRQGAGRT